MLTQEQQYQLVYAFTLFKPKTLGLTQSQFDFLKVEMAGEHPQTILNNINKYKRANELKEKLANQKEEEKRLNINCGLTPLKENQNRKIELMYNDDNPHNKKGILRDPKAAKKRKRKLIIKEGSPERRHYVPGNIIRPVAAPEELNPRIPRAATPDNTRSRIEVTRKAMTSVMTSRHTSRIPLCASTLKRPPPRARRYLTPPRTPPVQYCTPPNKAKAMPRGTPKKIVKPTTKKEEEEDKDVFLNYLNNIPMSRNTPIEVLRNCRPGTIIEFID